MATVRITHHNGSFETFEAATFEVVRGGALKVKEKGHPTRFFSPTGWASVTKEQ